MSCARRRAGIHLDLAEHEVLQQQIDYLKGSEVGRRWWAAYKGDDPKDEIVARIDKAMSTSAYDWNRKYVDTFLPSQPDH